MAAPCRSIPRTCRRSCCAAAAVLIVGAILSIGAARLTGAPLVAMPPISVPAAERALVIVRDADGGVRVTDAESGARGRRARPAGAPASSPASTAR